jgi:hypothetical protein
MRWANAAPELRNDQELPSEQSPMPQRERERFGMAEPLAVA